MDLVCLKELLKTNIGSKRQFELQARVLEEKAMKLMDASHALKAIISEVNDNEPAPWETLIKLMKVYCMTEKLTQKWVKEILTSDELRQYVACETEWKKT